MPLGVLRSFLFVLTACLLSTTSQLFAQTSLLSTLCIYSADSSRNCYPDAMVMIDGKKVLPVKVMEGNEQLTLRFQITEDDEALNSLTLAESLAFQVISQPVKIDSFYQAVIQLNDPVTYTFFQLKVLAVLKDSLQLEQSIQAFANINPGIVYDTEVLELYQEEERSLELFLPIPYSVKVDGRWNTTRDYDYRLTYGVNALVLQIKGHTLGSKTIRLNLKTTAPMLLSKQSLSYDLSPIEIQILVKPNRLEFLNVDKSSVYISNDYKYSQELLIDNSRNIGLQRTYRIEDAQEGGGNLIAELFTVSPVANGKVLCKLRTFALHKMSEGYLYLKENDRTRFITNFNIIEKPRIDRLQILPDGGDWTGSLVVFPGQRIEAKVEGKGFDESSITFDGVTGLRYDSLKSSAEVAYYTMTVPTTVNKKNIELFLNRKPSGHSLSVREFQKPSDFDFVSINFGDGYTALNNQRFDKPVFYESSIQEINIVFDAQKVDKGDRFYGKQYLKMEIRLINSRNALLDIVNLNNLVVCPDEGSLRGNYYQRNDCRSASIALNEYLRQKTFDLEPFSQILITLTHDESRYGGNSGYTRKVNLVLKRKVNFDIQFSFPAGLYLLQFVPNESQVVDRLTGVSTTVLAQLNFYDPNRIGRLRPYSVGVGFLGLNALNFNNQAQRDIGVVILGSLVPIRRDIRFFIPLYLGGGYLIDAERFFLVFGPGVQFRF